jgi:hypothetical protein
MHSIWNDVEGGLSKYIEEQKKDPGDVVFSLVVFDTQSVDTVYDRKNIKDL